jgi:hypothetical protein
MKTKYLLVVGSLSAISFTSAEPAFAQSWMLTSAPFTNWAAVACSADGHKLVAVIRGGGIYASTNFGAAWTATTAPAANWSAVASSADGGKVAAVVAGGGIYSSLDSGINWTLANAPATNSWSSIASSADGLRLVAAIGESTNPITSAAGPIFTSADSGATWSPHGPTANWTSVASSADGRKLVAIGWANFLICVSRDWGATWTSTNGGWYPVSVASSADGARLVLTGLDPFHCMNGCGGPIYTSTNAAQTWEARPGNTAGRGSVASSADGIRLLAAGGDNFLFSSVGGIITSPDSGNTWMAASAPSTNWSSIASSADGSKLVAVVEGGGIYTWQSTATPLLSIARSESHTVISWTVPSMDFVLQQNSHLTTTNWMDLTNALVLNLTNLQNQVSIPTGSTTERFYRLRH